MLRRIAAMSDPMEDEIDTDDAKRQITSQHSVTAMAISASPRSIPIEAMLGNYGGDYLDYFFFHGSLQELVSECDWMADCVLSFYDSYKHTREYDYHKEWKNMAKQSDDCDLLHFMMIAIISNVPAVRARVQQYTQPRRFEALMAYIQDTLPRFADGQSVPDHEPRDSKGRKRLLFPHYSNYIRQLVAFLPQMPQQPNNYAGRLAYHQAALRIREEGNNRRMGTSSSCVRVNNDE